MNTFMEDAGELNAATDFVLPIEPNPDNNAAPFQFNPWWQMFQCKL